MPPTRTIRTFIFSLLAIALLAPAVASAAKPVRGTFDEARTARVALGASERPSARATQHGCENADLQPAAGNLAEVRAAVLCLHNEIRERHDLPLLRENLRLRRAAAGHSEDMVARRYFEHTAPGGVTMVDRILRARYARSDQGWSFGENLAWGTGRLATPRGVMRAWMESPGHRANVLRRSYRELGVGVVTGIPSGAGHGATYTADFGVRR
jgi:uncharacterized protein YkwD